MELFVSSGVAMLYLPILWFQLIQDTVRFERLVEMFRRMVVAFPVSEMVLTPFPLDPMANRAYDLVLKGKGFADAAKLLSTSERVRWFVRKGSVTWAEENLSG
jgi:hypothetical protein